LENARGEKQQTESENKSIRARAEQIQCRIKYRLGNTSNVFQIKKV